MYRKCAKPAHFVFYAVTRGISRVMRDSACILGVTEAYREPGEHSPNMATDLSPGVSLTVPDFFTGEETAQALKIFTEALGVEVSDNGLRRTLSSGEAAQPIQIALYIIGSVGLNVLGSAGWDAIKAAYARVRDLYDGRVVSLEITAQDDAGRNADYLLPDGSDEALRAIPADLARDVRGTRVQYDVDEGWLTWEEAQAKKYGKRAQ